MNTAGERETERLFLHGSCESYKCVFFYQRGGRREKVCVQYIGACEVGGGYCPRAESFVLYTHTQMSHIYKHIQVKVLATHNTPT